MTELGDEQDRAEQVDNDTLSDVDDDPEGSLEYPPDRPLGVEDYGTTAAEERVDEPLTERLRREVPDRFDTLDGPDDAELIIIELAENDDDIDFDEELDSLAPVGRLVDPGAEDDGIFAVDDESDAIARQVDEDDLSAEEAAVHLTAAPRFLADDDGYVDGDVEGDGDD